MTPLNFLTARSLYEQAKRLAGVVVDAPMIRDEFPCVDLRDMPIWPGNGKQYPGTRDVSKIGLIVGHVTDVPGGFGVQKWSDNGWRKWGKMLAAGEAPPDLVDTLEAQGVEGDDMPRALAHCSRYRQTPYHRVASEKLGEVINRPLSRRTKASSAGNGGVAMAVDCHHREDISERLAQIGRETFHGLYRDLRAKGYEGTVLYAPHGCFDRDRWSDTHRITHMRVFKVAVLELRSWGEDIKIDYERAVSGGRAITTRDDPDAHFDERGRRVMRSTGELL